MATAPLCIHRWLVAFTFLIALGVQVASAALLDPPLNVTLDNRFPTVGQAMNFTITGPPGVQFELKASSTATEAFLPNWGTVFIETGGLLQIGSGVLDSNGEGSVSVNVPNNANILGRVFYFQVKGVLGADQGVSNSISARMQEFSLSGARQPAALVVTADGAKAYVAHEHDGSVSVIDAVNDALITDMPISEVPLGVGKPISMAIDPEGRHLFVADPRMREVIVVHIESDSVAGSIPTPGGTNGIAFDFSGPKKVVYFTNTKERAVLGFEEFPAGTFSPLTTVPVEGHGPGPIVVLGDGNLVVGNRQSLDVELIDPDAVGGAITLARTTLDSLPLDLLVRGNELLVPTFTPEPLPDNGDGTNEVLAIDLSTFLLDGNSHWSDLGTDYFDLESNGDLIAMTAAGSGSVLMADHDSLLFSDLLDLAPGQPTTHPVDLAFVPDSGGGERVYALNHFRESIRAIELTSGPPFVLGPEIPLAYSGQPRIPLVDLTTLENGDWMYSTVEFFNGSATNPNRVTCNTCHTWYFSAGFINAAGLQAQPLFDLGQTGPWLYGANFDDLIDKTHALFNSHGVVGGPLTAMAESLMTDFQESGVSRTPSPFLNDDGSMTAEALAGKALFEGVANCSSCHAGSWFIPIDEADRTIAAGVGTGMAPINVTSLLGLWSTGPYLHDGSAETLLDVLTSNTGDAHGVTSSLTPTELDQIVAYLQSL